MTDREIKAAKNRKKNRMDPVQHGMLFGADAIAKFFRVSREVVLEWAEDGAPIVRSGKRYDADSKSVQHWRELTLDAENGNW